MRSAVTASTAVKAVSAMDSSMMSSPRCWLDKPPRGNGPHGTAAFLHDSSTEDARRVWHLEGVKDVGREREAFSAAARVRSLGFAANGVRTLLESQDNARIHALATGAVVAAGVASGLGRLEWLALVFAIVSVWMAEALNTAFEFLCDVASPEFHPLVARAKDVAAAAVLFGAVGALVIAAVVFMPRLAPLFWWQ